MAEEVKKGVKETPQATEVKTVVVEKKKGGGCTGCLIALGIFLFIIACLVGAGYWGYKKIVSSLSTKVDLGEVYSAADYTSALADNGLYIPDPSVLCFDCDVPTFGDFVEGSVSFSGKQAAAVFDTINENLTYGQVSGTQIKFGDGTAELSTTFTYNGKGYPVYLAGSVEKATDVSVTGNITSLKVGGLTLPSSFANFVEDTLVTIANDRLANIGGDFRMDDLSIDTAGVHFTGVYPSSVE